MKKVILVVFLTVTLILRSQITESSNGNVGIGTTNPSEKLDLSTSISYNSFNSNGIKLGNSNETSVNVGKSHSFTFKTFGDANGIRLGIFQKSRNQNDFEVLSIINNKIGIGTINPLEKLDLSTNISYNSFNSNGIKLGNSNETSVNIDKSHSFTFKTFGDANGIRLGIIQHSRNQNDLEILSIKNDNLGIGTTNPDMKLTVKGKVHAEEVKIDLNVPAPDYVFENNYDLKTIQEVENYIKENKHLPEIPSATEFEKNGLMLGEMDMSLLKKIEELTLYTIKQEKRLDRQSEEIEELKALVQKLLELKK